MDPTGDLRFPIILGTDPLAVFPNLATAGFQVALEPIHQRMFAFVTAVEENTLAGLSLM